MPDTPLAAAQTTDLLCAFVDKLMNGAQSDVLKTIIDTELSCTQLQTLTMLYCDDDELPIHRIAEALGLSVAAAGRGVDKLVRLGLLVRREDEQDRRIKRISLSVSGRKLVADQFAAVHDRNREFVTRLPDGLRDQLSKALGQILLGGYLGPLPADCIASTIASTLPSKGST